LAGSNTDLFQDAIWRMPDQHHALWCLVDVDCSMTTMINKSYVTRQALLVSGVLSSIWYVVLNIYVPTQYEGLVNCK
jgi:hypothetical protein